VGYRLPPCWGKNDLLLPAVSNEAVHHRFREVRSAYERQLEGVRRAFSGESASVTPFNTTAPINESGFVASSSNNDMAGTSTAIQPGLTMQQENYFQYDFHIDPELWSGSPLQYIPDTAASFQNPYVANAYPVAPEPKRKAEHGELEPKDEVPSSKRARRE
jgi:hypothetical protein